MNKLLPILIFLVSAHTAFSQVPETDSMLPKIAAEKNDSARARIIWDCLGNSETDPVLDMQIADKLLVQSKELNDPVEEVIALACLGYDYRLFGDNAKSWKYNLQAIAAAERNPNLEAKAIANLALAMNYAGMSDYPKSGKLLSTAIEYASKTKFDKVLSLCYTFMGELYLDMNKVDSALMFTQRGYEINTQIHYTDYLGPLLEQLGTIHAKLGNAALAIGFYNMAVNTSYIIKSPKFINTSYTALAQYYYDAHQVDSAIFYSKKAIAIVQNTAFTNYSLTAAKLLLDIYRNTNIDSAFKYSEIYRIANDSLFNAKTVQETQLLALEENIREQQLAEEAHKAAEQNKQNIQLALIALGIVTFIILFLLLSRSFITNTKMIEFLGVLALLLVFEFLNLLLHPLLGKVTNHSPAVMLLALVCIAAILIPLHHRLEKWATERMVEKNKAIRLAEAKKTIESWKGKRMHKPFVRQ